LKRNLRPLFSRDDSAGNKSPPPEGECHIKDGLHKSGVKKGEPTRQTFYVVAVRKTRATLRLGKGKG